MKKIKIAAAIFAAMLSLQGFSQVKDSVSTPEMDKDHNIENKKSEQYCASMKDGKMVIMFQDNIVNEDVTLADGTMISPDGSVSESKGTKTQLLDGQCVNKDGVIGAGEDKEEPTSKKKPANKNKEVNKPKNKPANSVAKAKKSD